MRSRKVRYGEQKLVELIDMEMKKISNLDYSQIKEKIIINDEKGIKNVEQKRIFFVKRLKYALSIILIIVSIVTYCTICSINKEVNFETSYYLTDVLIEEFEKSNLYRKTISYFQNTNLLSVLINNNSESRKLAITLNNDYLDKYYCAYLDKEMIDKVNEYFTENNIQDTDMFKSLYQSNLFIGIDMLLLKTYIYFKNLDINKLHENINWIEYQDDKNIRYEIDNNQLIFVTIINKVNDIIDIETNNQYNVNIALYNEMNFTVKKNIVVLKNINQQNRKFLCYFKEIEENKQLNISLKYLENYCAEIVDINESTYIYINIPKWYEIYLKTDDITLYESMQDNILMVENILNEISKYKIYEEVYYYSNSLYFNRYYYDYNKIKSFLLF